TGGVNMVISTLRTRPRSGLRPHTRHRPANHADPVPHCDGPRGTKARQTMWAHGPIHARVSGVRLGVLTIKTGQGAWRTTSSVTCRASQRGTPRRVAGNFV